MNQEKFWATFKVAFTNECITYVMMYLMYPYMVKMNVSHKAPLPEAWKVWIQFYIFVYMSEFIFYYSHR